MTTRRVTIPIRSTLVREEQPDGSPFTFRWYRIDKQVAIGATIVDIGGVVDQASASSLVLVAGAVSVVLEPGKVDIAELDGKHVSTIQLRAHYSMLSGGPFGSDDMFQRPTTGELSVLVEDDGLEPEAASS